MTLACFIFLSVLALSVILEIEFRYWNWYFCGFCERTTVLCMWCGNNECNGGSGCVFCRFNRPLLNYLRKRGCWVIFTKEHCDHQIWKAKQSFKELMGDGTL